MDGAQSAPVGDALRAFREWFYGCLRTRADALFELCDALLSAGTVPSPVHLSLEMVHRRGWGSLYAALRYGRIEAEALRDLLADHRLTDDPDRARVYAVDRSSWPRCDAECSPDRGYYYHPSRHSAGQPIVAGTSALPGCWGSWSPAAASGAWSKGFHLVPASAPLF